MAEHGFYHPSAGYWQTNDDVSAEIIAAYPEGTAEVDLRPVGGCFELEDSHWVPCDPPTPSIDDQLASIEAAFDTKKLALVELLATVMLVDGPNEATQITELKTAYAAACDEKAAAIGALLFGEL